MRSKIRSATKADIVGFYGEMLPVSCRAIVLEIDDSPVMIAGVMHGSTLIAFMDMRDRLRQSPRELIKAIPAYRDLLNSYTRTIMAKANENEGNAPRFLERVGFEPVERARLYRWPFH